MNENLHPTESLGATALKARLKNCTKIFFRGQEIPNPYTVLNISSATPLEKIRKSYKRVIRSVHPDLYRSTDALVLSQIVNSAFDLLSNKASKEAIDQILARSTVTKKRESHPKSTTYSSEQTNVRTEKNSYAQNEKRTLRNNWGQYAHLEKIVDSNRIDIIDELIACYPWLIPTRFWKSDEDTLQDLRATGFNVLAMDYSNLFYVVLPPLIEGKNYSDWVRDTESYGSLLIRKRAIAQYRILFNSNDRIVLQK